MRQDHQQLSLVLSKLKENMKDNLQNEMIFGSNMDDLISRSNVSGVVRNSINPGQNANIKKSIRGAAGSQYRKGPNQSVHLESVRNVSMHIPSGESLQWESSD